jgi:hypothetical protein
MPAKTVRQTENFLKIYGCLENSVKLKLDKLMIKLVLEPKFGKPMRFARKGTREAYLKPHRLSYAYDEKGGIITFLDLYHKDKQ